MTRFAPRGAFWMIALCLTGAHPAAAQLRPLEPLMWEVFEGERALSAEVGVGLHRGQRASLAGVEGELLEVGNAQATWRTGRVALEVGGTVLRVFEDRTVFAPAAGGADPEAGPRRVDTGDLHVATTVRLTPGSERALAVLRFGTRLPNSNNRLGLDRDRTDFFALLGGRVRRGPLAAATELGLGIYGSHDLRQEQADLLVYALEAEYRLGVLAPVVALVGHRYGSSRVLRGNEALSEARVGIRAGGRRWIEVRLVRGLTDFSPGGGLLLSAGASR